VDRSRTDRVPAGRARRCAARPDEDAVTLAAEAGAEALAGLSEPPGSLIFASVHATYDEGGSVQVLAELLGLPENTWVTELTATMRDGLAAVRLALALVAAQGRPVLVCGAHRRRDEGDGESADGAVALLIGPAGAGLAGLRAGDAHTEGAPRPLAAGRATWRPARATRASCTSSARPASPAWWPRPRATPPARWPSPGRAPARPGVWRRACAAAAIPPSPGPAILGAAHPLLRLACGIGAPGVVVGASGGLAEAVHVEPRAGAGGRR